MPWYTYKAVDNHGHAIKGDMEAESEIGLTTELAKKGLLPVNISYRRNPVARPSISFSFKRQAGLRKRKLLFFRDSLLPLSRQQSLSWKD